MDNILQRYWYSKGFVLEQDYTIPNKFDADQNKNVIVIHLAHAAMTFSGNDDPNSLPPFAKRILPELTKTVNIDFAFINHNGTDFKGHIPATAHQVIKIYGRATIDMTNGQLVTTKTDSKGQIIVDHNLPALSYDWPTTYAKPVPFPSEEGYVAETDQPQTAIKIIVSDGSQSGSDPLKGDTIVLDQLGTVINQGHLTRNVYYDTDEQYLQYTLIDDTTGHVLVTPTRLHTHGGSDNDVDHAVRNEVNDILLNYTNHGYVINSDVFDAIPQHFDHDDSVDQLVTIHLAHGVATIKHDTIAADVPANSPVQPTDLSKTVHLTVNYQNQDGSTFTGNVPSNASQNILVTGTAYVDKVTGHLTNAPVDSVSINYRNFPTTSPIVDTHATTTPAIIWATNHTETVDSPAEKGYTPDQATVPAMNLSVGDSDNDWATGSNIVLGPSTKNASLSRTVTYTADPQIIDYQIIDDATGRTIVGPTQLAAGVTHGNIPASATTDLDTIVNNYLAHGYTLVSRDNIPTTFDDDDNTNQLVTVHLNHKTTTVTPDHPHKNTDPLPDNPDHHYPDGVDQNDLNKTITRTINLHLPDGSVRSIVQTVHLTRSATVDEATGQITHYTDWTTGNWPKFDVPTINGYNASMSRVAEQDVDANTSDITIDIYYHAISNPNHNGKGDSGNHNGIGGNSTNGNNQGNFPGQLSEANSQDNNAKKAQTLPQTGNNDSLGLVGLGLLSFTTMLGLGLRRRN